MAKTWEEMTAQEKTEDLRRDVKALFAELNTLNARVDGLSNQTTTNLRRMGAMIDQINDRLKKGGVP
jgi:uncharacterized protein YlxW (UPF0749 family)